MITVKDRIPSRIDQSKLQEAINTVANGVEVALKVEWQDGEPTAIHFVTPEGVDEKAIIRVIQEYQLAENEPDEKQKSEASAVGSVDAATRLEALEARVVALEAKMK